MSFKRVILAVAVIFGVTLGVMALIRKPSTSDTIIKMAVKGASETELLAAVDASRQEPLSADDIIKLKQAGISNKVVFEMLHKSGTN